MKTGEREALLLTVVMGAVIFFCRFFPFLFFGKGMSANGRDGEDKPSARTAFLGFVEKTVPPAAMTVLAFNALAGPIKAGSGGAISVLAASVFTALLHLWRRNPLVSIFGGTALYMILERIIPRMPGVLS
jgi:branched-subunit amino acid transport protein AzlD